MGVIKKDEKQINVIYSGDTAIGKKVRGYLESSDKKILPIDITETMPSSTQWQEIAQDLDVSIKTFIDTDKVAKLDENSDYSEDNYLKVLENNPNALKGVILINKNMQKHIVNTTEVFEFFGVDSAGLEKTFYTEKPTTKPTTNGDKFK